jgi:DNA-binding response OmpR family regulator
MVRPRILVAEDDERLRLVLTRCLNEDGYQVETARDGEVAFALASTLRFAAVVTDARMPRLSGPELIRALRLQQPHLPCLLLSGDGDFGAQALPDDVLTLAKPFTPDRLLELVRALLPA